uniref:Uncharacterized protein n=1 Tax=viral metagenome TaxID=1070528 RepID=A0A6C0CVP9_9ZZZZ
MSIFLYMFKKMKINICKMNLLYLEDNFIKTYLILTY